MTDHRVAAAWVEHLCSGGTTTWSEWVREPRIAAGTGGNVPGAAQLELLRRVNEVGPAPELADRILHRPGPGRGRARLALPSPATDEAAPVKEVLRVGTGVLADLSAQLPPVARPRPARGRLWEGSGRGFVLAGLPLTVAGLRAGLAAAGVREHRPVKPWFGGEPKRPRLAVLLVAPLEEHLRQAWTLATERGEARPWPRFVAAWARRGELPRSVRLHEHVGSWAAEVGVGNVHVVTTAALDHRLPELLGGHVRPGRPAPGAPTPLSTECVDVLRRVNTVLPFLVDDRERMARRNALVALMGRERPGPTRVDVPRAYRQWVRGAGLRLGEALIGTGCQVHGDLAELSRLSRSGERVRPRPVLDEMVRMIRWADQTLRCGDGRETA